MAAVALNAALGLLPASWERAGPRQAARARWLAYTTVGAVAAATVGPYLVLVLLACGASEVLVCGERYSGPEGPRNVSLLALAAVAAPLAGVGALVFEAFKVGALSYGGGFVIIPLMQSDVVHTYHWMTNAQFLDAVALGQITPGPVVQTVAVVGYAAAKLWGGLLAAFVAFAPSFFFVLLGGRRFDQVRANKQVQAFLKGAGPAAIGAIAGAAVPLGLALAHLWQFGVLAAALVWLVAMRRNVVAGLLAAGVVGAVGSLLGLPAGP